MAAIGGNQEAARLSGIKVEIVRMLGFVIVGLGAALAGIILTSQAQSYYANAATGYLLPAYAGVFLGAATLRANQFHILGTFLGVLFMQTIQTGLIILNRVPPTSSRDLLCSQCCSPVGARGRRPPCCVRTERPVRPSGSGAGRPEADVKLRARGGRSSGGRRTSSRRR
jgi:hypothetical protein